LPPKQDQTAADDYDHHSRRDSVSSVSNVSHEEHHSHSKATSSKAMVEQTAPRKSEIHMFIKHSTHSTVEIGPNTRTIIDTGANAHATVNTNIPVRYRKPTARSKEHSASDLEESDTSQEETPVKPAAKATKGRTSKAAHKAEKYESPASVHHMSLREHPTPRRRFDLAGETRSETPGKRGHRISTYISPPPKHKATSTAGKSTKGHK